LNEVDRLISLQREALRRNSVPKVTLSTCHGAKGREWQAVFVPFCNENVFPDARSTEGDYLDAERKLFYVSMTRASEHLVLSYAGFRPDTNRVQEPSRFLVEAGLVEPPKQKKTQAASSSPRNATRGSSSRRIERSGSSASAAPWWNKQSSPSTPASASPATRAKRMVTLFSVRSRVTFDGVDATKVGNIVTRLLDDEE